MKKKYTKKLNKKIINSHHKRKTQKYSTGGTVDNFVCTITIEKNDNILTLKYKINNNDDYKIINIDEQLKNKIEEKIKKLTDKAD